MFPGRLASDVADIGIPTVSLGRPTDAMRENVPRNAPLKVIELADSFVDNVVSQFRTIVLTCVNAALFVT